MASAVFIADSNDVWPAFIAESKAVWLDLTADSNALCPAFMLVSSELIAAPCNFEISETRDDIGIIMLIASANCLGSGLLVFTSALFSMSIDTWSIVGTAIARAGGIAHWGGDCLAGLEP